MWVFGEPSEYNLSRFADVSIDMPDLLDINHLRARGLQPGEEELPDISPPVVIPDSKGTIYCQEDLLDPSTLLCWNSPFFPPLRCPLVPSCVVTHCGHTEVKPGCNCKLTVVMGRGTETHPEWPKWARGNHWQQRAANLQRVFRLCCL